MSYDVLQNWQYGLDTRRSQLTSQPGVLLDITNAHINAGGEIEKRKAFMLDNVVTPSVASGVSAILGVEFLKDEIVLFGAQANADGAWPSAGSLMDYSYIRLYRTYGCGFTITGASGNITLTAPKVGGGTVVIANAVAFVTSAANTASLVVTAINNTTETSGYSAQNVGAFITINAPKLIHDLKVRLSITGTLTTSGTSYLIPSSNASSRIYSTVYGDYAFVLAGMDDGTTCAFYCNGDTPYEAIPIKDFFVGEVLPGALGVGTLTNAEVMSMLAQAASDVDELVYTGKRTTSTTTTVQSKNASNLSGEVVNEGSIAITSALTDSTSVSSADGVAATGSFRIAGGSDGTSYGATNAITSILVGATELLPGGPAAIPFNDDIRTTVVDVVTAINTNSGVSGYSAVGQGDTVIITSNTVGDQDNGKVVQVSTSGDVIIGDVGVEVAGTDFSLTNINVNGFNVIGSAADYPGGHTTISAYLTALAGSVYTGPSSNAVALGYAMTAFNPPGSPNLLLGKRVTKCNDQDVGVEFVWTGDGVFADKVNQSFFVGVNPNTLQVNGPLRRIGSTVVPSSQFVRIQTPLVAVPNGGLAPYTYSWQLLPQAAGESFPLALKIETPSAQKTFIQAAFILFSTYPPATYQREINCVVKDSSGSQVLSASATLVCIYKGF